MADDLGTLGTVSVGVVPDLDEFGNEFSDGVSNAIESASDDVASAMDSTMSQGAEKASQSVGAQMESTFGTIGTAVGTVFAGAFVLQAIGAYDQIEKATNTLRFNLEALGQEESLPSLVDWAQEFAKNTDLSTAAVLQMASKLTGLGSVFFESVGPEAEKYVRDLTAALTDMSAALGRPIASLMRSLGPSILNTPAKAVNTLLKWSAVTEEQADAVRALVAEEENLAATQLIINALTEKFGGAAAAAQTPLGNLQNNFEMVREQVGEYLNPALTLFSNIITRIPIPIQAVVSSGVAAVQMFTGFALVLGTMSGGGGLLASFGRAWSDIKIIFQTIGRTIVRVLASLGLMTAATIADTTAEVANTSAKIANTAAAAAQGKVYQQLTLFKEADTVATTANTAANAAGVGIFGKALIGVKALAGVLGPATAIGVGFAAALTAGTAALTAWDPLNLVDDQKKWNEEMEEGTLILGKFTSATLFGKGRGALGMTPTLDLAEWSGDAADMEAKQARLIAQIEALKDQYSGAIATGMEFFENLSDVIETTANRTRKSIGVLKEYGGFLGTDLVSMALAARRAINEVGVSTEEQDQIIQATIAQSRAAWVAWRDSTASSINFVIDSLSDLASRDKITAEGIHRNLQRQLQDMRQFGKNLDKIAEDGTRGAQALVEQLIAMGPAGQDMAEKIANASPKVRQAIERDIGKSLTTAKNTAGDLERALIGGMNNIAAAILVATGEANTLKEALKQLEQQKDIEIGVTINFTRNGNPYGFTGGERAEGGPVVAGRSYLVGEEGPEIFTPTTGGKIISNDDARGTLGSNVETQSSRPRGPRQKVPVSGTLKIIDLREGIAELNAEIDWDDRRGEQY